MIWVWMKRWLLIVVGIPVVAWLLDQVADRLEESKGEETGVTRSMHDAAGTIRQWRANRRGGRGRQPARSKTA